jgi:hypothetical protein
VFHEGQEEDGMMYEDNGLTGSTLHDDDDDGDGDEEEEEEAEEE